MVSFRKKGQSNSRLLSQLDNIDREVFIGNATRDRQKSFVVNEGTVYQEFTVNKAGSNLRGNDSLVIVKSLERCFIERIDKEMVNIVDTVEDGFQNATLSAIDSIVTPKIELGLRSINASSGRDETSDTANSERGQRIKITAPFESVSKSNNTLHVLNTNDETRNSIPDDVSELSVPKTHFD